MARDLQDILDSGELVNGDFDGKITSKGLETKQGSVFRLQNYTTAVDPETEYCSLFYNQQGMPDLNINYPVLSFYPADIDDNAPADAGLAFAVYANGAYHKVMDTRDVMPIIDEFFTFDYEIVESLDILTTDPDWSDVLTLTTPDRGAGIYGLVFSLKFTHATTSQSFFYRFSIDGGATWGMEYEKEVKDRHNTEVIEVVDVLDHSGGIIDLRVQATREGTSACTVIKTFVSVERKK